MRRHPIAVYRVIDEEELLGGEGLERLDGEHGLSPAPESAVRITRSPRRWRLGGWGSTAAAVAALVGLAGLLMSVASHVPSPAALPAAAPPLHPPAPATPRAVSASPRHASPRRAPRRRRPRSTRRVPARWRSRVHVVRALSVVAHASARATAGLTDGPSAAPAPFRADQEFGFER